MKTTVEPIDTRFNCFWFLFFCLFDRNTWVKTAFYFTQLSRRPLSLVGE